MFGVNTADRNSPSEKPDAMMPVVVLEKSATAACTPINEPCRPLPMDISRMATIRGQIVRSAETMPCS
jgi:hypothetical protein